MSKNGIAVQMYSLRNECEKDFTGTLKKVADLGFDGVELAGYGGMSAAELKAVLDNLNLKAASNHVQLARLESEPEQVIREQKVLGCDHIVCPVLPRDRHSREDYEKLVQTLNEVGEMSAAEGITLSYHNHDFELLPFEDGVVPLAYIMDQSNPDWVKAEFDVYWLKKAGEDPVEWLKKYQERTPLVHLKDMTTDGEEFFAELGTGGVDIEAVLEHTASVPVEWWIIEQDQSRKTPLESIEQSINYLKKQTV
ncbi:sugar phosphate isomerase/epimerase family protein [Jeotgalibacillus salarius]|uniref:Sugar phosphate isomerase/epimerase n=1 Tax=Jeotgalibacillus salarius TaxID=546023 RepID=A0A4Y8LF01_9BACL|nr:sugar phosphate isomerase/epimerase [Jeotgalibacillus salarius]TFE00623.1 sugar phosphate isomerase/epimerase [Jeotgalibacillus salarius]